jgi:ATP-dependent DNA helicase UvrD/PcrA
MDMPITQINSDTLIPIEEHFRISAGPGAGKTHWLINHIKNVLHQSARLSKTRKIACITYTNVAVETIVRRLGLSTAQIDVSTIHSFLYRHIVKPYASFLVEEYGLNVKKLDGHDDVILSNYSFISEWKGKTGQQRISDHNELAKAFAKARWRFDGDALIVKPDYPYIIGNYPVKTDSYFEYKKMAWERGVIHHDDVLFFSYQLLLKLPFILQVLRAKFPYFFVDEFQDTNNIQANILSRIGQEETIVGIIGDKAQSIYSFQGADPSQFSSFTLPEMQEYQMAVNRRSTNQIIDLLNTIRTDIQQIKLNNIEGRKATIIVSERIASFRKAQELCNNEELCSLSRDNVTSNAMKKSMNQNVPSEDLLQSLAGVDSDRDRKKLIIACIKSTELARQKRFKEAIKELERRFKNTIDANAGKKEALKHINLLLREYDEIKEMTLLNFHSFVKGNIRGSIADLRRGNIKAFYENHTYQQLAVCVKITEDTSIHRTIHKAKGAEFDNVLLVLEEDADFAFLLSPDLENKEEHRINYVAISRAKKQVFITTPVLSTSNTTRLSALFDIITL